MNFQLSQPKRKRVHGKGQALDAAERLASALIRTSRELDSTLGSALFSMSITPMLPLTFLAAAEQNARVSVSLTAW